MHITARVISSRILSLSVEKDDVVAILGRNGVGKTTLLRSIMNFDEPRSEGVIRFEGTDISSLPAHRISSLGVGFVPQERRMFGSLTVDQNLQMATIGVDSPRYTPDDIYDVFPALTEIQNQQARTLSGGQQQMVTIGRGLIGDTKLLLLDEPLEGLAPTIVSDLKSAIEDLSSDLTIIMVEQKVSEVMDVASYGHIIDRGTVVFQGNREEFDHRSEEVRRHLAV
jgi:branched-chain amino acid transport system ATP-binding protein